MIKTWKSASQDECVKCFDILNTDSLIERETYVKFAKELFEIAKKQLGCNGTKLVFVESMGNNLGFATAATNTVTLSLEKLDKQNLHKTVSTVYHELTHIRQDKIKVRKKINTTKPAIFPFIHCHVNNSFLPAEILGTNPSYFYYTCREEKEARDVGSECALELFTALKNIAQTRETKNGTIRLIDRAIEQTQERRNREKENNAFATMEVWKFMGENPNFTHTAFERVKQEFNNSTRGIRTFTQERIQCESTFNKRVGVLVLMGCDDKLKADILNFVATNFVSQGEIFNTLITVTDSPYSTTTKEDLMLLFQFARANNFPEEDMLKYLTNWDKQYVIDIVNGKNPTDNNGWMKGF